MVSQPSVAFEKGEYPIVGDSSKVVPPQLRRRVILRRVWGYRFVQSAGACYFALVLLVLRDWETVMLHHSGVQFWLALTLASLALPFTLLAAFFFLTEKPKPVEVLDNPFSETNVKHLAD